MVSLAKCSIVEPKSFTVIASPGSTPVYRSNGTSFLGYRIAEEGVIGFTAELSQDTPLSPGGRIMFDRVLHNYGLRYVDLHGYFRCPDDNLYAFSLSTQTPSDAGADVWSVTRLMFDREAVIDCPVTNYNPEPESGTASVTTVLQCRNGRDLYVEAVQSYTHVQNLYAADRTSFSGVRICAENTCSNYTAFSTVLAQNFTSDESANTNVQFSRIITNSGNAYDNATGAFICPDNDAYYITWSATVTNCADCSVDLYFGGRLYKRNFVTYSSSSVFRTSGTSTMSAIIPCVEGRNVTVEVADFGSSSVLLAGLTTFSGYKIPNQ